MTNKNVISLVLQGVQNRMKRQNTLFKTLNFITKVFMMHHLLMSNYSFSVKLTFKQIEYFDMLASIHHIYYKEICIKHMKCQSTQDAFFFFFFILTSKQNKISTFPSMALFSLKGCAL